jgi:hypothetical protein
VTQKDAVLKEVDEMPEPLLGELLDFIKSLKLKAAIQRSETAIASQSALEKDWLSSEEDEAWRDL